jgi:hypothetical protein
MWCIYNTSRIVLRAFWPVMFLSLTPPYSFSSCNNLRLFSLCAAIIIVLNPLSLSLTRSHSINAHTLFEYPNARSQPPSTLGVLHPRRVLHHQVISPAQNGFVYVKI